MRALSTPRTQPSTSPPPNVSPRGVGDTSCWSLLLMPWSVASLQPYRASISNNMLSGQHYTVLIISLIGLIVWPTAIALCRGYRRNRIGVGFDEPGAVMRAGMAVVVACALPTGLMAVPSGALDPNGVALTIYAILKLVAIGTPFAVLLSLVVRFLARRVLHQLQRRGRSLRHVVVVGSFTAAQQLSERIRREPNAGMKVIGICLPSSRAAQARGGRSSGAWELEPSVGGSPCQGVRCRGRD